MSEDKYLVHFPGKFRKFFINAFVISLFFDLVQFFHRPAMSGEPHAVYGVSALVKRASHGLETQGRRGKAVEHKDAGTFTLEVNFLDF